MKKKEKRFERNYPFLKKALREINKLDEAREKLQNENMKINNKMDEVMEIIQKKALEIRITDVSKTALDFRKKLLRDKRISSILKEYRISIGDVALVKYRDEEIRKHNFISGTKTTYWSRPQRLMSPEDNLWNGTMRYTYGGPLDRIKVLFRESKNFQYYVCGFMTNFPMKHEKAA
jgi:hypothetical protein